MLESLAQQLKTICQQYVAEGTPVTYTRLGHAPVVVKVLFSPSSSDSILVNDLGQRTLMLIANPSDFPLGPPQPNDMFEMSLPGAVRAKWSVVNPTNIRMLGSVVLQYRIEVKG